MRRTRAITLTLLSAAMLTSACGRRQTSTTHPAAPPDRTWYDANHNPIPEVWEQKDGKRVPSPIPHDRYGRPWVQDANGEWGPLPPPEATHAAGTTHGGTTHTYHGSSWVPWIYGGSGYRSYSSSPPPAARPPAGARPATGGTSSGSRVSGGFGSTGSSMSAGS